MIRALCHLHLMLRFGMRLEARFGTMSDGTWSCYIWSPVGNSAEAWGSSGSPLSAYRAALRNLSEGR